MKPVIRIENLSKQYRLGTVGTGSFAHDAKRWWYNVRGKEDPYIKIGETNDRAIKGNSNYVWALKDINFEVQQGEVLGIIGKNGAGKSTLLKLLSRVTAPTTGIIEARGRIASLLEVGTGFHPELTGRENVYLNGAIMGMTKMEVKAKLDEIVDFSGCERYIDTPVKRYSSGMTVRLAFAVAAHLEPEILIVDEVLAVGDAEFQKKAIGKMQDVSRGGGRTVLFVSHNMAAVKSLCNKAMVLSNGGCNFAGNVTEAVEFYLQEGNKTGNSLAWKVNEAPGNDKVRITEVKVFASDSKIIDINSGFNLSLSLFSNMKNANLDCTIEVINQEEIVIFHVGTLLTAEKDSDIGEYNIICEIPNNFLNAGNYKLNILIGENQRYVLLRVDDILRFEVQNVSQGYAMNKKPGVVRPLLNWKITKPVTVNG